jgi:glycerol-3-phosphate acyltransferase PlsY
LSLGEVYSSAPALLLAVLVGYLLGAIPLAHLISRRLGVDIFSVGTGLPGASNVLRSVGRVPALFALFGDMGKGAAAVIAGEFLGLEGPWIIFPVAAAVVGHWKPVFSGFRGGDALATLGGTTIALFPVFGIISVAVAMVLALGAQRLPYTSLLGTVMGYATLVALTLAYDGDTAVALGIVGVAGLVLAHALLGHRRRRSSEWDDVEDIGDTNGAPERSRSG